VNGQDLIAFRLRQRLNERDSALVKRVEDALGPGLVSQLQKAGAKLSQFSEFLNTALQARSAPVAAEWVRYQMSRGATRGQWKATGLGERVLDDIAALKEDAAHLAGEVYPKDRREEGTAEVWIELVRRYAGWLRRQFVATTGGEADDEQG
jgi:hypothetical protein